MALDTANKRRSVQGYTLTPIAPIPDGSIDAFDRAQMAWLYSGIESAAAVVTDTPTALLRGIRKLAARFGTYGAGTVKRPAALSGGARNSEPPVYLSGVMMAILLPGNQAAREHLAALGSDRARKLGYVAPGVDTTDGDVWEIGGETYVVDGVEAITDCRVCALSVYRRGA